MFHKLLIWPFISLVFQIRSFHFFSSNKPIDNVQRHTFLILDSSYHSGSEREERYAPPPAQPTHQTRNLIRPKPIMIPVDNQQPPSRDGKRLSAFKGNTFQGYRCNIELDLYIRIKIKEIIFIGRDSCVISCTYFISSYV